MSEEERRLLLDRIAQLKIKAAVEHFIVNEAIERVRTRLMARHDAMRAIIRTEGEE